MALGLAYALDLLLGEPPNRLHPVAGLGRVAGLGEPLADRGGRFAQLIAGAVSSLLAIAVFVGAALLSLRLLAFSPLLRLVATVFWLKVSFSAAALGRAGERMARALERGDLSAARGRLSWLCSRKPDTLGEDDLAAATIESLAENTSDSLVAPLFYFLLFGLPGALAYRAVNTLDAMYGYRGRYEYFGKAAARLDDVLNYIPARLTAVLLLVAGGVCGRDVRGGWSIARRDASNTPSPNAGWPMATMAGLLGLRLTKPGVYALGDPKSRVRVLDIRHAWSVCRLAMFLWVLLVAVLKRGQVL